MNILLTIFKIPLLIIGILTLPLGFIVGTPFLIISIPCLLGAVAIDSYQKSEKTPSQQTPKSNSIWSLIVVIVGVGLYFAITSFGSFGNIDTTGKPSSGTKSFALVFCVLVVILGLVIVNRNKTNKF